MFERWKHYIVATVFLSLPFIIVDYTYATIDEIETLILSYLAPFFTATGLFIIHYFYFHIVGFKGGNGLYLYVIIFTAFIIMGIPIVQPDL